MTKIIILMRHGEDNRETGDLTPYGISQVQDVTRQIIGAGLKPDIILTSHLPRTTQAAKAGVATFVAAGMEINQPRKTYDLIKKGRITAALQKLTNENVALLFSHEHQIAAAVWDLTGVRMNPKKAQAIVVEVDAPDWSNATRWNNASVRHIFQPFKLKS